MTVFVLNISGLVIIMTWFDLITTWFVLNMTGLVQNINEFVKFNFKSLAQICSTPNTKKNCMFNTFRIQEYPFSRDALLGISFVHGRTILLYAIYAIYQGRQKNGFCRLGSCRNWNQWHLTITTSALLCRGCSTNSIVSY